MVRECSLLDTLQLNSNSIQSEICSRKRSVFIGYILFYQWANIMQGAIHNYQRFPLESDHYLRVGGRCKSENRVHSKFAPPSTTAHSKPTFLLDFWIPSPFTTVLFIMENVYNYGWPPTYIPLFHICKVLKISGILGVYTIDLVWSISWKLFVHR